MTARGLLLAAACASAATALTLPTMWASSMVIQRGLPSSLWGMDTPGARVSVAWRGANVSTTADATGRFSVTLAAAPATTTPANLVIASSAGGVLTLADVLVGDVFVCSGQSNMELSVSNTVDAAAAATAADALGATLRIFQVAMLDEYVNAIAPADNLTASIPWARASAASVPGMSALCYFHGVEAVHAHPDVPIGMVASSWGGVPIQVYMSPAALAKCGGAAAMPPSLDELLIAARAPGAGLADKAAAAAALAHPRLGATPAKPSCLYFSMFAPLLLTPVSGVLWYQGESNAGDPNGYKCLQSSMILDWRASWAKVGSDADLPFVFIQLAAWPTGDSGMIPVMRVAVEDSLRLPKVGMVVAMDVSDPSGAYHPIHPPWKAEVARRAFLWTDAVVYGNASSPASSPRPVSVTFDAWQASWGDAWHLGTGGNSYVCEGGQWTCGGIRVRFDQPIRVRDFYAPQPWAPRNYYGFSSSASSGFEAFESVNVTATTWWQPLVLSGLADPYTAQLNVTWIGPVAKALPELLRYMWTDYAHAAPLENYFGLPVGPFNVTISA